jgi:hypothetical protein
MASGKMDLKIQCLKVLKGKSHLEQSVSCVMWFCLMSVFTVFQKKTASSILNVSE